MIRRFVFALFAVFVLLPAGSAQADCTSPAGAAGTQIYSSNYNTMLFCDGTNWWSMKGDSVWFYSAGDIYYYSGNIGLGAGTYLNFGPTFSSAGYGIRDNAGTIEIKNSGGSWAAPGGAETDPEVGAVANNQWCRGDGSAVQCDQAAPSAIPSGAVMAFDLASCPSGWTALTSAAGRMLIGVGTLGSDTYSLGNTGGEARHALSIAELASHTHSVDPPSTSTNTTGEHNHAMNGNAVATTSTAPTANRGGSNPLHYNTSTEDAGDHSHTVNIAPFDSAATGSGTAHENRPPYLALLICKKD